MILIDDPVNLFYHTGLHLSAGKLLLSDNGSHLYVDGRYLEMCREKAPMPVSPISEFSIEGEVTIDSRVMSFEAVAKLKNATPKPGLLQELRQVKRPDELLLLKKAASLAADGYDFVVSELKEGITEKELSRKLQIYWLDRGGEGPSFSPICAFGENSAYPHHACTDRPLKVGDAVLLDMGVQLGDYQSDMTRVVFFGGASSRMLEIYEIVRKALEAARKVAVPGAIAREVDHAARQLIEEAGYGSAFCHSLGHGVGLEVHEAPLLRHNSDTVLEKNMVVTIEPGIYLPGIGGVRLEDTIVVGNETLTPRPLDPIKISS